MAGLTLNDLGQVRQLGAIKTYGPQWRPHGVGVPYAATVLMTRYGEKAAAAAAILTRAPVAPLPAPKCPTGHDWSGMDCRITETEPQAAEMPKIILNDDIGNVTRMRNAVLAPAKAKEAYWRKHVTNWKKFYGYDNVNYQRRLKQAEGERASKETPPVGRPFFIYEAQTFLFGTQAISNVMGSYYGAFANWVYDTTMTPQAIKTAIDNGRMLMKVMNDIPWPHKFFKWFMTGSKMARRHTPPAFHKGMTYFDPNMAISDYFPKSESQIKKDIAQYLVDNADALARHFEVELNHWMRAKQRDIEEKQRKGMVIGFALAAIGGVFALIGAPVYIGAITAIAQTLTTIATAKSVGKATLAFIEKIYRILGIALTEIEKFKQWIAVHAESLPSPQAPLTPTDRVGAYSVFVEGKFVQSGEDVEALVRRGFSISEVGDRITLKDEVSGRTVYMVIHGSEGQMIRVPTDKIAATEVLPSGKIQEIAGKKADFPWWVLIPATALVLAK